MFYPLFALGIFLLPDVPFSSREKIKILLDAAIVIVSFSLIFWVLLIDPIVISIEVFNLEAIVSLAYPIMDLLLFIALILRMLKVGGRSATIVPDGVLFGSSKAHVQLRKHLVDDNQVEAVISLPSVTGH
jgi:hypothetical protein